MALVTEGRCNNNFILLSSLPTAACCFPQTFSVLPHAFLQSFSRFSSSFPCCRDTTCSFRPGYSTLCCIYVGNLECTELNQHRRLTALIYSFGSIYQAHIYRAVFKDFYSSLPAERISFKLALQCY